MTWYEIKNEAEIDSPALLVYPQHIQHNIDCMLQQVGGDAKRLCPHVKTHKMAEVVRMQLAVGIEQFKCATIAELEMTLAAGAKKVLIAYQMTGPNIPRFLKLAQQYPTATLAALVDNLASAKQLADAFAATGLTANVYLDVDNGMNRTGYPLNGTIFGMVQALTQIDHLYFQGLHIYDGQFRSDNVQERIKASDDAFAPVYVLTKRIADELGLKINVINGGSPSFSAAASRATVFCSPGTTLFWDYGYAQIVKETPFLWAALLLTRVISKPAEGIITLDLGHKSVASENPIAKRIHFLNLDNYEAIGHSEEHLVLKVADSKNITVGAIFYGVPYHICPSVALHEEAKVIRENIWVENWEVIARKRRISV